MSRSFSSFLAGWRSLILASNERFCRARIETWSSNSSERAAFSRSNRSLSLSIEVVFSWSTSIVYDISGVPKGTQSSFTDCYVLSNLTVRLLEYFPKLLFAISPRLHRIYSPRVVSPLLLVKDDALSLEVALSASLSDDHITTSILTSRHYRSFIIRISARIQINTRLYILPWSFLANANRDLALWEAELFAWSNIEGCEGADFVA